MIKKYKYKPIEINAIQYLGTNIKEIEDFIGCILFRYPDDNNELEGSLGIPTPKGIMKVPVGYYIVKDIKGEYYSYDPILFKNIYEEI